MTTESTASVAVTVGDQEIVFETGRLAKQADGAVVVRSGETLVLATAQGRQDTREGADFFPLTVDVEERMYAAGKIPGAVFRREGRPSEPAILTCRLTDRPLRPSFAEGFRNETQIVTTVLGADQSNQHDVLSINAASAALMISGIPFAGPVGAVRLAHHDGVWIPHPTYQEGDASTFELVVTGRRLPDGDVAVMMVEAGGTEATWELYEAGAPHVTEEVIAEGLEAAKKWINDSITAQLELVDAWVADRGPIQPIPYELQSDYDDDTLEAVRQAATDPLTEALSIADKHDRNDRINEISAETVAALAGTAEEPG
ncbi:MAG TPA: hypothetical protein VFR32_06090, partial [Gaiellaceae bacterium]|nr:hypothetical protein [Gaiellaceae bacterium]